MNQLPHQLGQLLIRRQAISAEQLNEALALQAHNPRPLGQALIDLGYITESTLNRALRQQRWLRPCAACFALIAPCSVSYADPQNTDSDFSQDWLEEAGRHYYSEPDHVSRHTDSFDLLKFAALTAWDIYQGEPQRGDIRYNLGESADHGYQLEMTIHF